jgi:hypothetical protein
MDAEGNAAYSKEAYESHVRRLMVILDQEQQARLRIEDKLEEARVCEACACLRCYLPAIDSSGAAQSSLGGGFTQHFAQRLL